MLKNPWQRILLVTFLVLTVNGLYLYMFPPATREPVIPIAYSRFKDELRQDHVAEVTIQGEVLTGSFTVPLATFYEETAADKSGEPRAYEHFRTNLPPIDDPGADPPARSPSSRDECRAARGLVSLGHPAG